MCRRVRVKFTFVKEKAYSMVWIKGIQEQNTDIFV
jgi:hypothetical protein